jgi:hypothetical protein
VVIKVSAKSHREKTAQKMIANKTKIAFYEINLAFISGSLFPFSPKGKNHCSLLWRSAHTQAGHNTAGQILISDNTHYWIQYKATLIHIIHIGPASKETFSFFLVLLVEKRNRQKKYIL